VDVPISEPNPKNGVLERKQNRKPLLPKNAPKPFFKKKANKKNVLSCPVLDAKKIRIKKINRKTHMQVTNLLITEKAGRK